MESCKRRAVRASRTSQQESESHQPDQGPVSERPLHQIEESQTAINDRPGAELAIPLARAIGKCGGLEIGDFTTAASSRESAEKSKANDEDPKQIQGQDDYEQAQGSTWVLSRREAHPSAVQVGGGRL